MLREAAAQGGLVLVGRAAAAQGVGEGDERERAARPDRRRVSARRIAHLKAAAQQRLLRRGVAVRAGGERLLEHDLGERGEQVRISSPATRTSAVRPVQRSALR
jgi:hypothetical protein